ncbi:NlpC/P60 family protein [Paracoccus suum]|uniref:NlpC/P60 family protein n=1 Tax=Paracoccus suum TaxID=2259340 RepID=A0A344PH35_9RHOB|nr:C40 family peptidase [Paracoccus suum]AXC48690.1 NlpC/P60 family protein [Paracoccus suum]
MSDRRTTPATDRIALERLRGAVDRPAYTAGRPATVIAPVVDLCAAPDGPRERQLLFGAPVTAVDTEGAWTFVEARDDGYCGWLNSGTLAEGLPPATHRVAVPATHVYHHPDIKNGEVMSLSLGARLAVTGTEGRFACLSGGGFVPLVHLSDQPAGDPVEVAELLLGTPYLWGGNSRSGIDCSGLAQTALRACGRNCPGDSDQQFAAMSHEVPLAEIQRGDLLFWRGHVAMATGPDRMIHANGHTMSVAYEGITAALTRIESAGDGAFLGVRRP